MREQVVILGAAGFIGTALCRRLRSRYDVVAVDHRPGSVLEADGVSPMGVDVADPLQVDRAVQAWISDPRPLAGIVDLVAHYDFRNQADPRYDRVELGLEHLLGQILRHVPQDVPFLFASSMASLAPTDPGQRQTERSPRLGAWAYPAHKLRCEAILERSPMPQPRVELVLAAVYSDWCELVPLYFQLERVRTGSLQALMYPGRTDRGLTYVHVDDCARAFEAALSHARGRRGVHRYLVGELEPTTYGSIQKVAGEAFGGPTRALRVPKFLARTGAAVLGASDASNFVRPWMVQFAGEHFEFDGSKIREDLGWSPSRWLGEGLPAMCRRARTDPEKWVRLNEARPR